MDIQSLLYLLSRGVGNPFASDKYLSLFNQFLRNGDCRAVIFNKFGQSVLEILEKIKHCKEDSKKLMLIEKEIRSNILFEDEN